MRTTSPFLLGFGVEETACHERRLLTEASCSALLAEHEAFHIAEMLNFQFNFRSFPCVLVSRHFASRTSIFHDHLSVPSTDNFSNPIAFISCAHMMYTM